MGKVANRLGAPRRRPYRGLRTGPGAGSLAALALLVAWAGLAPIAPASAQYMAGSHLTTGELAVECDRAEAADKPLDAFPFCAGYLLGMIDGTVIARRAGGMIDYCPPEDGLGIAQLLPLFLGWVKDNPGAAPEPARRSIRRLLEEAYPCRPRR